jgi:hypothetical protein
MIRRALRVSSAARPSSWLCVAAGLVLSMAFIWAFPALWRGLEASLPWWIEQAIPPVLYGLLTSLSVRRARWPRLLGATALLWAAHLIVGALIGAVVPSAVAAATTVGLSVPVFPQFLWVPLLLIPLHDVIAGDRRPERASGMSRARTRVPSVPAPTPSTSAAETPASSAVSAPLPPERATTRGPGDMSARAVTVAPTEATASGVAAKPSTRRISVTTIPEVPTARPALDEMLARDTPGDVIRITFERVLDQLPAAGFNVPIDRIADSLREPGHLLIPTRLALAQLAEGIVRAGWETVADQFPKQVLALSDAEIAKRLRDGQLVLPLDELVPQLPSELFRSTRPLIDLHGIEEFPEPFKPAGQEPAAPAAERSVESASSDVVPAAAPAEPRRPLPTADARDAQSAAPPANVGVASGVELTIPTQPAWDEDESTGPAAARSHRLDERENAAPADPPVHQVGESAMRASASGDFPVGTVREPHPDALVADGSVHAGRPTREPDSIDAAVRSLEMTPLRVGLPVAEPIADSPRPDAPARDDRLIAAEMCSLLSSAGPLNSTVDAEDGVTVLCISAPGLSTTTAVATARLVLPIMTDGCAPWPIGQLTLRGAGEALVLTPLPPMGSNGRMLMVMVPAGGSLALLETLCRRAAAPQGNHARPSPGPRGGNSGLLELEPSTRMRGIADSFDAAGTMMTVAFRDAETVLALFLPADWDAHAVAGVASDLARAMRKGGTCAGPWQTADAVGGERRLMLRLPDLASGCADVITVVGGRIDRRGLAYRQLESAAQALRAG